MKKTALLLLLALGPAFAEPTSARQDGSCAKVAQSSSVTAAPSKALSITQGGLVDIRYGQISIDIGGTGIVLEVRPETKLRLDGASINAEELLQRVPEGLTAVATHHLQEGIALSVDAFSSGRELSAALLEVVPKERALFQAGEFFTVLLPAAEQKRLGPGPFMVSLPGLSPPKSMAVAQRGGLKTSFRVPIGADLTQVPLFLHTPKEIYKGRRLSFSSSPPKILDFGPTRASSSTEKIPGWIDLQSASGLLDLSTAKLTVSSGAKVLDFQPRVDRSVFRIETEGPGEYWLEFSIKDTLGRTVGKRWSVVVQP